MITSWFADDPGPAYAPRVLTNISLDLAVAQGAAYYGVVRRGEGIRIGGGTARSFYVGLETGAAEKPWLCVVPRDSQEGEEITIAGHDFDLLMGQPVVFPLASSSVRPDDKPGDLVRADPDSIRELPPLQSLMRVSRKAKAERAPVSLAARVTEVGTIELWCQSRTDDRRWRLQIQLRGPSGQLAPRGSVDRRRIRPGRDRTVRARCRDRRDPARRSKAARPPATPPPPSPSEDTGPARLVKRLEEVLDVPRDEWPPSALRTFWDPLLACAEKRLKSPRHESRWFNLAGFFLRPGRGFPLDDVRIKALWPIFHQGVKHIKDVQCWAEWWILWRRVAAGLARPHHDEIYRRLAPFLLPAKGSSPAKKAGRPKPEAHELAEMWRCAASLERVRARRQGIARRRSRQGARPGLARRPRLLVPGPAGRPGAALRAGQHRRSQGGRRALDERAARSRVRRRARNRRRHLRAGAAREGRQRPRPRPRRLAPADESSPA